MKRVLEIAERELVAYLREQEMREYKERMNELVDFFRTIMREGALEESSLTPHLAYATVLGSRLAMNNMPLEALLQVMKHMRLGMTRVLLGDPTLQGEAYAQRMLLITEGLTDLLNRLFLGFHEQQQEELVKMYEQQRNQVLDALPVSIVVYDIEERFLFANSRVYANNGLTPEQVIGRHRNELTDAYNRFPEPDDAWELALKGEWVKFRVESVTEDGLSLNDKELLPLRNKEGDVVAIVVMSHPEVSEKERLYNLQKQFSFVLNSMNSGLLVLNQDMVVTGYNKKAEQIFHIPAENVLGRDLHDLYVTHVDDKREQAEIPPRFMLSKPIRDKQRTLTVDERTITVRIDGNPIHDANGRTAGYVLIIDDLTELVAMREAMMRNEKFALIGQFAAGIAHEIRNPLTTVNGFLQLFAKGSTPQEKFLELTRTLLLAELGRANSILSDFLMISRPTAPKMTEVDTGQFFRDVVRLIESEAHLKGVELYVDVPDELPTLSLDVQQMKQVFLNLCKNGFDVMGPDGVLTLQVAVSEGEVVFEVIDRGPGIPAKELPRIFEPFFTTKSHGTGLGLPISHRIVEGHGGRLEVRSTEGAGTTFAVAIPVRA